ncbi:MAG: hypothetical protein GX421_06535 [Caldisericales bacterium]|nr:hypothetical protein [Caldisericales bacterium]
MQDIDEVLEEVEGHRMSPEEGARRMREYRMKKRFSGGLFFGVYLVLQGLAVLFHQLGYFPGTGSWWNIVWPVILFTAGLQMVFSKGRRGGFSLMGAVLCSIGIARMVVNAEIITLGQWWSWFWPVALIVVGIDILYHSLTGTIREDFIHYGEF